MNQFDDFDAANLGGILQPVNPLRSPYLPPRLSPLPDDAFQQFESGLGGIPEAINALTLFTSLFP